MIDSNRIYFPHFDVIRFVAAFMITIVHAYESWCGWFGNLGFLSGGTYEELTTGGKYADTFIRNMGIGVDIFFLLSGFLITYILLEEKKRFGKVQIGKFMIRRALRIWPLYFFLIAIAPLLVYWMDSPIQPNYLANIFFVGNFDIIQSHQWDFPFSHFWSICIEEHFYLIWPFIIAFIPQKKLIWFFGAFIIGTVFFRVFSSATDPGPYYTLYLHTFSRIDVLVIGAIGAYYYSIRPFTFKLNRFLRWGLFSTLIIVLSLDAYNNWTTLFMVGMKKYLYISLIAILLLDYNFNAGFRHFLRNKSIIHYFGKISYGIYMYSNIILLIVMQKIILAYNITNVWLFFLLIISLSIIIPIISYEFFEKHLLKLSKKFRVVETQR